MDTKNLRRLSSKRNLQIFALSALCVVGSFTVGIHTAGDVQPIALIQAGSEAHQGDVTGDGAVDERDVVAILEVAEGYRMATPDELKADPNGDGQLTVADAMAILSRL